MPTAWRSWRTWAAPALLALSAVIICGVCAALTTPSLAPYGVGWGLGAISATLFLVPACRASHQGRP